MILIVQCCLVSNISLSSKFINMRIFRVLGLGLAIIMIRFLVPEVFHALEDTFLTFFTVVETVLTKVETSPNTASLIQLLPK